MPTGSPARCPNWWWRGGCHERGGNHIHPSEGMGNLSGILVHSHFAHIADKQYRMKEIYSALELKDDVVFAHACASLPSCFQVSRLLSSAVGAVGSALSTLITRAGIARDRPEIVVDCRLASLWCGRSIYPVDWSLPPIWDALSGDYPTRDGWIRIHANLAHHREAALRVLGAAATREDVAGAVQGWNGEDLDREINAKGGAAAAMRSLSEWRAHPQGIAVSSEPLIAWEPVDQRRPRSWPAQQHRPLNGLRILDLTRVLAGPVATRTLTGFGAQVLRVDPPDWDEPAVVPDVTLGKRCTRLDLRQPDDRARFEALLRDADVLVHGYRPGALEGLGYDAAIRRALNPRLLEVSLNAYGWTGPWSRRRGFDSLVQMSCGIAREGMKWKGKPHPVPLPVQALDHATGYLMAAAVLRMLDAAISGGGISRARLSLARTAVLLLNHRQDSVGEQDISAKADDLDTVIERTPWGDARRLKPPLAISGIPMKWDRPANMLGADHAVWIP